MAKTVKKNKKITTESPGNTSLEVKTPYPKEEKDKKYNKSGKLPPLKSDIDYWGEKMVKLQDRVNELELSVNDMNAKLKQVTGRMGL